MTNISDEGQAWEWIRTSAESASFVPVLDFELSCLPQYSMIPRDARKVFGQISVQMDHLGIQASRIDEAVAALSDTSERACMEYLQAYASRGITRRPEPDDCGPALKNLTVNLTRLASTLTQHWARRLSDDPHPLSTADTRTVALYVEDPAPVLNMRRTLNCCAELWRMAEEGVEPSSLHSEWIYEKMLLLASEVFEPGELWEGVDPCAELACCDAACCRHFADRHAPFIYERPGETNWSEDLTVYRATGEERGVRFGHLLWLEGLLRHVLLSGTRAYRTRNQLAFLLALNDKITELPDAAADPFEMGLLYAPFSLGDNAVLHDFLTSCEQGNNEGRVPQPFHWALARLLKHARGVAAKSRNPAVRDRAKKQVILSMCFDREMERALAREFPRFRVAVPVNAPTLNENSEVIWLVASCEADEAEGLPGYRVVEWSDSSYGPALDLEWEGPLVLKLFGSPLELPLPDTGSSTFDGFKHVDTGKALSHRLVVDETELLSTLYRIVPDSIADLMSHLKNSQLFFFGQSAVTWSGRVPYFMVKNIDAAEHEEGAYGGPEDEAGFAYQARAVSIAEPTVFSKKTLQRLNISYPVGEAKPDAVVRKLIEEVANLA